MAIPAPQPPAEAACPSPTFIGFDESNNVFVDFLVWLYIYLASAILLLMCIYHVGVEVSRRYWRFPSRPSTLLAFNAGTLALLGIAVKPPNDTRESTDAFSKLFGTVLLCALLGAYMPSLATRHLTDMWSNVAGVALLVVTVIVNIYLQLCTNIIQELRLEHGMVVIFTGLLLLVILTQALAAEAMMSDIRAMVTDQLEEIRPEVTRPGYKFGVMKEKPWTWDALEQESLIKLMMVLTSNPQNVAARCSSIAAVGVLVVASFIMLLQASVRVWSRSLDRNFLILLSPGKYSAISLLQGPTVFLCGCICVWRWVRVALHEDRPLLSLLQTAEPSYWRRKVRKCRHELRAGHLDQRSQRNVQKVLCYTADFLVLSTIVPIHRMLVAVISFLHILSALLLQSLIRPIKLTSPYVCWFSSRRDSRKMAASIAAASEFLWLQSLGVICLEGEDVGNVRRQFVTAATIVIQKQTMRMHSTKEQTANLVTFLHGTNRRSIFRVLERGGAPEVADNLHVEYGYEYGWSLTLLSLLAVLREIEMETLGASEAFEAAIDVYEQAKGMVNVVDEQYTPIVCSKETYAGAAAAVWSNLLKKRRSRFSEEDSSDLKDPKDVLKALLAPVEHHMREFSKTMLNRSAVASWPEQTVMFYTMHTLCRNLLSWWDDLVQNGNGRANTKMLVEYMSVMLADILAACLSNLPIALSKCTTAAVRDGKAEVVENSIFLIAQGKQLWESLDWPTPPAAPADTFGQLCQWF